LTCGGASGPTSICPRPCPGPPDVPAAAGTQPAGRTTPGSDGIAGRDGIAGKDGRGGSEGRLGNPVPAGAVPAGTNRSTRYGAFQVTYRSPSGVVTFSAGTPLTCPHGRAADGKPPVFARAVRNRAASAGGLIGLPSAFPSGLDVARIQRSFNADVGRLPGRTPGRSGRFSGSFR
jgi:hypothetical protein